MLKFIFCMLLFLSASGALTVTTKCDCNSFSSESECNNVQNCTWSNSSCGLKPCANLILERCETYFRCSINNSGVCEDMKACSNYSADTQIDCMFRRGNCAAEDTLTNGKYLCKTYTPVKCSTQAADKCKNTFESENSFCWLNSQGTCQSYNPNTCVGIPLEICSNLGCDNSGSQCKAYICSSNLTQSSCTWVSDGYFGPKTLCKWNASTTKCEERTDTSDLTQNQCSLLTDGGYYWSQDKCVQCTTTPEETSFSVLARIVVVLLIIQ